MARIIVTAIIPKGELEWAIFEREITNAMTVHVKPLLKADFSKTVRGWQKPPQFRGTIRKKQGTSITLTYKPIGANAQQYALVSLGSPPHVIKPKGVRGLGGNLIFRGGYQAATSPGSLSSRAKARFGPLQSRKIVHHPGFKGRQFGTQIADKNRHIFTRMMMSAVNTAANKTRWVDE